MKEQTVLFVDDDQHVLKALKRLFFDEPYRVLFAESGEQGLQLIQEGERPAVIVSDERMPKMSGSEFLALASQIYPDSIRIILTGYADLKAIVSAVNKSILFRYIFKPWNDEDLKFAVSEGLKYYMLGAENKILNEQLQEKTVLLEEANSSLENKVVERTKELQIVLQDKENLNIELQRKVRELKGRDRILNHILSIHPYDETLQTILEVVIDVMAVDSAALYLQDSSKNQLKLEISLNSSDSTDLPQTIIESVFDKSSKCFSLAAEVYSKGVSSVDIWDQKGCSQLSVPIFKNEACLGVIQVVKYNLPALSEDAFPTIERLSKLAVVAISDSLMQQDNSWANDIDEFLKSEVR